MAVPLTVSAASSAALPHSGSEVSPQRVDTSESSLSPSSIADSLQQLQLAISDGDEVQAQQLAALLAKQKTKLSISQVNPASQPDKAIRVKIFVEDRQRTGSFVFMNLKPSMKFEELKRKMLSEYGFPPEVQVWIVGQRIARDTETLERREVNKSGCIMYLYLRSAESVGLTPHDYRIKYGHLFPNDSHLGGEATPALYHGEGSRGSYRSPASQSSYRSPGSAASQSPRQRPIDENTASQNVPGIRSAATPQQKSESSIHPKSSAVQISKQSGWSCPACTFINIPTRPGCEICGQDRPATYRLPEKLDLPVSEKQRLEREAQYERLTKELHEVQMREMEVKRGQTQRGDLFGGTAAGASRGSQQQQPYHQREQQLHHMLQLNDQINSYRARYQSGDLPRDVFEDIVRLEAEMDTGMEVLRKLQDDDDGHEAPRKTPRRVRIVERSDGGHNSDSDEEPPPAAGRQVYVYLPNRGETSDSKDEDVTPAISQITIGDGNVTYIGRQEPREPQEFSDPENY